MSRVTSSVLLAALLSSVGPQLACDPGTQLVPGFEEEPPLVEEELPPDPELEPEPDAGEPEDDGGEPISELPGDDAGTEPPQTPDAGTPARDAGTPFPYVTCTAVTACAKAPATFTPGLTPFNPCGYRLKGAAQTTARVALINKLKQKLAAVTPGAVVKDGNRMARPLTAAAVAPVSNPKLAFTWNLEDEKTKAWMPQGITGSADADASGLVEGRRMVLASWYHRPENEPAGTPDKGVRISFVDVTDPANIRYRHALLVEPYDDGGVANFRVVRMHAGGLVWYGRYLYVPSTFYGFRVFDLQNILKVATDADTIGWNAAAGKYRAYKYQYVIPEVGRYGLTDPCHTRFSYAALDRSTTPPSLITGEFDGSAKDGQLFRWPTLASGALQGQGGVIAPVGGWYTGKNRIQGALFYGDKAYLSCLNQVGTSSRLYRLTDTTSTAYGWGYYPEDLYLDSTRNWLWSLTELTTKRFVFAVTRP